MSAARDLFLTVNLAAVHGNAPAYEKLSKAAELWRVDGQHFSAGIAMLHAVDAGWGEPDKMLVAQCAAAKDFEEAISRNAPDSPVSIAALFKLQQSLFRALRLFELDDATIRIRAEELKSELAQRLVNCFSGSEHADNYLVRGIVITTRLDGDWTVSFPAYEVPLGMEQFGQEYLFNVPSAFHLFAADRDWRGAHQIVEACESAFTSPGLRGWRAVTFAHVRPLEAIARFDEAADAFAADAQPPWEEMETRGGSWSGINQQLWAKYFRARARVVESMQNPQKVKELLTSAAEVLSGTESGWHSGVVSRFGVIVKVLLNLVSDPFSFSDAEARREYELEVRMSHETEEDRHALTFVSEAAAGFRGLATDPASELTHNRVGLALAELGKTLIIEPEVTNAVRVEIGKSVLAVILGSNRTWMHRALEGITDEGQFRRVILRLLQSGLPLYAHVRHGPLEYGKDISALLKIQGVLVLRHFQVKCGNIDTPKWRESRNELEEIFLVPLASLNLPAAPQRIEAVLVTTGHANPYVEPTMTGWFKEQREKHARDVTFMHLDGLVDWIVRDRLVNELRAALEEQGVAVAAAR
jgi:hypothetical protein